MRILTFFIILVFISGCGVSWFEPSPFDDKVLELTEDRSVEEILIEYFDKPLSEVPAEELYELLVDIDQRAEERGANNMRDAIVVWGLLVGAFTAGVFATIE